jgi:outer membrane protein assembly factor BamD (BamD/ComL family)
MKKEIKYTAATIFFVIIISGCASEKKEWENTKQKNTTFAYEDYLNSYPKGLHSDSAKIHLESLYFQDALYADTIPLFETFINKYPQSTYSDSAQALLEKLYFEQAKYADTIPTYEDFLKRNPQSVFADSAQILLGKLYYWQAQKINTINAFQNFIEKYPSSQLVPKAKDKLITLEWEAAKNINSIYSYKEFIAKYSESQFVEMAKVKISNIKLLKKCPFELITGKIIGLRNHKAGDSFSSTFEEGNIKSLESGGWLIQGLGRKLLNVEQKMSGSYNLKIYWIDQPFKVSYNGKFIASFKNTAEYWKMLNE